MYVSSVSDLIKLLDEFPHPENEQERKQLWDCTARFAARIEDEFNLQHRLLAAPLQMVVPRVASDLHVFETLIKSENPVSTDEIVSNSKADPLLIARILRYLASQHFVKSSGQELWSSTNLTPYLANPNYASALRFGSLCVLPSCQALSELLASSNYADLSTALSSGTAFQLAHKTSLNMFEWLRTRPEDLQDFNIWMAEAGRRQMSSWNVLDPFLSDLIRSPGSANTTDGIRSEELRNHLTASRSPDEHSTIAHGPSKATQQTDQGNGVKLEKPERCFLIDVGGGNGNFSEKLKSRHPIIQERIINQDIQAAVPENVDSSSIWINEAGIKSMRHNFLEPQPISGSQIYQFRRVTHNWGDEDVVKMLRHTRDAMEDDSFLLIDDLVLAQDGQNRYGCYVDLVMGMFFGSRERTLGEFRLIAEKAELKILQSLPYMDGSEETILVLAKNG